MLTVDPNNRISIHEIKNHPCFRWNLPENFILPQPLPVEYIKEKMPDDVMNVIIKACSLSSESIQEELRSDSNNLPKVISSMLLNSMDIESLPWDSTDSCVHSNSLSPLNGFSILLRSNTNPNLDSIDNDPFHRHANASSPVVFHNSLVSHPNWYYDELNDNIGLSIISEREYIPNENIPISDFSLMIQRIQIVFSAINGIKWFYPDPTIIYIRGNNADFFAEIRVKFENMNVKILFFHIKGNEELFNEFCSIVFKYLDQIHQKKI